MPLPENASPEQKRQQRQPKREGGGENACPPISGATAPLTLHPVFSPSHKTSMPQPRHSTTANGKKCTQRRIHNKKSNPNAATPFNHRARFTKLKRGIHAQRQRALRSLRLAEPKRGTGAVARIGSSETPPPLLSPSSSTEDWATDTGNNISSCTRNVRHGSPLTVERTVAAMNSLYTRLAASMTNRQYRRAKALKKCIRAGQLRLRRELRDRPLQNALECNTDPTSRHASLRAGAGLQQMQKTVFTRDSATPSPYRSFYPPSTWLGLGRHPHSAWVDQRTGRYPQLCTDGYLKVVVLYFMNGEVADLGTVPDTSMEAMIPAPPSSSLPSSPPHTALSRSQRAMKSSLFAAAYCTNVLTDALDDLCFTLLQGLYKEQRDLRQKQPLQFKARQRYVVGFQEALKCLKAGRVRLVLLATDVEVVELPAPAPPPPPQSLDIAASEGRTASTSARPASTSTRKKAAFHTLREAVQLVQQLCGVSGSATHDPIPSLGRNNTRAPPPCVCCMSRQRLSYALYAKGSKVGCVAVLQAEKNREALKAVMCYARYLTNVYTAELGTEMAAEKDVQQ
ncbi:hypothetical protein JKF63_03796 [Porcisia hertigi]|uniref:Ribosomal protein L7Ae/L30e/S12e/Gadd45 domain-containing protein n=1 Tax=Porcisia hertigi TaxID=2761500 RepID=A0A836HCF6_9TRYP|nr:hypothetical protein JKF63_03796 [Porcisia hertigi]